MLSEAKFQEGLIDTTMMHGGAAYKLDPGTGTLPKGWPDLLILPGYGRVVFAELKVAGGTVEPEQRRILKLLCISGYEACFMDPRPEYCVPYAMEPKEIDEYEPPERD